MKKFKLTIIREVTFVGYFEIEAESEEHAQELWAKSYREPPHYCDEVEFQEDEVKEEYVEEIKELAKEKSRNQLELDLAVDLLLDDG